MSDLFDVMGFEESNPVETVSNYQDTDQNKKKKDVTFFNYADQIMSKSDSLEFIDKKCSAHMLAMHFSHVNSFLDIVNKINPYVYNLNNKLVYTYFYDKIPKGKRFIRWTKKNKKKEQVLTELETRYNISSREALASVIGINVNED